MYPCNYQGQGMVPFNPMMGGYWSVPLQPWCNNYYFNPLLHEFDDKEEQENQFRENKEEEKELSENRQYPPEGPEQFSGGYPGQYPGGYPGQYPGGYPGGYPGQFPGYGVTPAEVLRYIEFNTDIFRTMLSFRIPAPAARRLINRIIRASLRFCRPPIY